MLEDKLKGMIGLARRAGRLGCGSVAVEKCLNSGKCTLVLIDEAASANTLEAFTKQSRFANVPIKLLPQGLLEKSLGEYRMCAAVSDENFSKQMLKYID